MTDNVHYMNEDGIRLRSSGEHEWVAQFLCEPPPPFPPGVYCARCSHTDPMYFDQMVPNRRGEDVSCCSNKDCGCTSHMTAWFKVGD